MINIFFKMKEQYIKTEMEYAFNFWVMIISGIFTKTITFAVPFVMYNNIPDIGGWSRDEIYLIMSFFCITEGLCSILFQGIWNLPQMIFDGQFDVVLSRPISPMLQVLSYEIGLQGIGDLIFGIISLNICLYSLHLFSFITIIICLFLIICGTIICLSIYIFTNSLVFWYDTGGRTMIAYTVSNIGQYAKYPVTIYPKVIQILLLFIIPYGFIGMVPVMILRGEHKISYSLTMIGISLFFFWFSKHIFNRGIRRYESIGM